MYKPVILVDFDKTISPVHGFHSPPLKETVEAISKLKQKYTITIFSCRANESICSPVDFVKMVEYLDQHGVPYDSIMHGKPLFHAIIDDRSYNPHHIGWDGILDKLLGE